MAGRPRRTRIYGANYDIGESYYKKALDNLDRKQLPSSHIESSPIGLARPSRLTDDLLAPSSILKKSLYDDDEPLVDYMPQKPLRKSLPIFDDDDAEEDNRITRRLAELKKATELTMDDEIRSSSKRLKELRKSADLGFDDEVRSSVPRFSAQKQLAESAFDDEIRSSVGRFGAHKKASEAFLDDFTAIKERPRRAKALLDFDDFTSDLGTAKSEIFKATATTTSASSRASATRERLANIEFEMSERADKQMQRDKRSANLKKFMSETGVETANKLVKKVTF